MAGTTIRSYIDLLEASQAPRGISKFDLFDWSLVAAPSGQPNPKAAKTAGRPKAAKLVKTVDAEPVQWWVPNWRGR